MKLPRHINRILLICSSVCLMFVFSSMIAFASDNPDATKPDSTKQARMRNTAPDHHERRDSSSTNPGHHTTQPGRQESPHTQPPSHESDFFGDLLGSLLIDPLFDRNATDAHDYYHHREVHHGDLSGAMTKATGEHANDHEGRENSDRSRQDEHGERHEYGSTVIVTETGSEGPNTPGIDIFDSNTHWLSLSYGQGSLKSNDFYGYSDISVAFEAFNEEQSPMNRIDLVVGGSYAPLQETSKLRKSLDGGVTLLHAGIRYNLYTTPRYTFMGNYLFAGGHLNWMFWEYNHPVDATDYDGWTKVTSDALVGLDLQIGTGWNLAQTNGFATGIECTPGLIVWSPETDRKFHNDIFSTFYYLRLSYMMHVRL